MSTLAPESAALCAASLSSGHRATATVLRAELDGGPDGALETLDGLEGQVRSGVLVPGDQRPQHRSVLLDVAGDVRQLVYEQAPDARRQVVVTHEGVLEIRIVRSGVHRAMHPEVQP